MPPLKAQVISNLILPACCFGPQSAVSQLCCTLNLDEKQVNKSDDSFYFSIEEISYKLVSVVMLCSYPFQP